MLGGTVAFAKAQTRVLQGGVLGTYLIFTIATTVLLSGYALLTRAAPSLPSVGPLRAHEAIVAALILAGAVSVVLARTRLVAVFALGVVGYGTALVFLFFGGPDLAMTQLAVETLCTNRDLAPDAGGAGHHGPGAGRGRSLREHPRRRRPESPLRTAGRRPHGLCQV